MRRGVNGSGEMDKGPANEADLKINNKAHSPGEGIRSLKTSSAFRILNFELYAKPRKSTMVFGVLAFSFCVGYLAYLNNCYDKQKFYVATAEDGQSILQPKKSRWES